MIKLGTRVYKTTDEFIKEVIDLAGAILVGVLAEARRRREIHVDRARNKAVKAVQKGIPASVMKN